MIRLLPLAVVALLWLTPAALAHKPSDSYLTLTLDPGRGPTGRWDVALRDLEMLVGLDADLDGRITWGEVAARETDIFAAVLPRLTVTADGGAVDLRPTGLRFVRHSDGGYAVLDFASARTADVRRELAVTYDLLFADDPTHRGLLVVRGPGGELLEGPLVLSPAANTAAVEVAGPGPPDGFVVHLWRGVRRLWLDPRHVLLVAAVLLPTVLRRQGLPPLWEPAGPGPALRAAAGVTAAFAVGESVTLWLAATDLLTPPGWAVGPAVTLSVVAAAGLNLNAKVGGAGPAAAFGFGLIHGFGLSNSFALAAGDTFSAIAAAGFNFGVVLGQTAAAAAVFLPAALVVIGIAGLVSLAGAGT